MIVLAPAQLRARIAQSPQPDWTTFCSCDVVLTETDQAAGYCTNCGIELKTHEFLDSEESKWLNESTNTN
jgi:hypothetical protein